jgi:hypothetical protein
MGAGCSNLNKINNVCDVMDCVKSVEVLDSSTSRSLSEQWILTFKDDVNYEDSPVKNAFMKFFVDKQFSTESKTYTDALKYEIRVYKNIIRPIVDFNICPNFVRYLGSGEMCNETDMTKVLDDEGKDNFSERMFTKTHRGRYGDGLVFPFDYSKQETNIKYNVLITELAKDKTFYDFMTENSDPDVLQDLIFQTLIACYVMSLAGLMHNDLHLNNIFVEEQEERDMYYDLIIDGEKNVVKLPNQKFIVKVFDFDRSYSKNLGVNTFLDGYDEFIPQKDMAQFLSYIISLKQFDPEELINIMSQKPDLMMDEFNSSEQLSIENWDVRSDVNDPATILLNFIKRYQTFSDILEDVDAMGAYHVDPELFKVTNNKLVIHHPLEQKETMEIGVEKDDTIFWKKVFDREHVDINTSLDRHSEITMTMYKKLVDWLGEVCMSKSYHAKIFFLTVDVLDLYIKNTPTEIKLKEFQLIGGCALLVAMFVATGVDNIRDLICIMDNAYTSDQMHLKTNEIIEAIGWELDVPTYYDVLEKMESDKDSYLFNITLFSLKVLIVESPGVDQGYNRANFIKVVLDIVEQKSLNVNYRAETKDSIKSTMKNLDLRKVRYLRAGQKEMLKTVVDSLSK